MNLEKLRVHFELQSLAFTAPLLCLCVLVVTECIPALATAKKYTPMWWMLLGIALGFIGQFVDNFYWGFPWSFHYLDNPFAAKLNQNGVFSNFIFRQGFGIASLYCHLRAFIAPERGAMNSNRLMRMVHYFFISALVAGQLYILFLYLVKNNYI